MLELEVLPLINSSDEVTLEISQRNQNIIGQTQISGNQVPILSTQSLNTSVRLPNRGIVVLGGIVQEEDSDNVNGLPFLSKIPIIKRLTGSTNISKVRRELLIFLQPTIIESSNDLIDANIEKVSPTVVGEEALEIGKPEPEVDPALFPDLQRPRRLFPRKQTDPAIEGGSYYYEEPALPQSGAVEGAADFPARIEEIDEEKPRKRLFNFNFNQREPSPPGEVDDSKSTRRGIFGRRR